MTETEIIENMKLETLKSSVKGEYFYPWIIRAYEELESDVIYALCKATVFYKKYKAANADDGWWYEQPEESEKGKETTSLTLWSQFTHSSYLAEIIRMYYKYNLKTIKQLYEAIEFLINADPPFGNLQNKPDYKISDIKSEDWYYQRYYQSKTSF